MLFCDDMTKNYQTRYVDYNNSNNNRRKGKKNYFMKRLIKKITPYFFSFLIAIILSCILFFNEIRGYLQTNRHIKNNIEIEKIIDLIDNISAFSFNVNSLLFSLLLIIGMSLLFYTLWNYVPYRAVGFYKDRTLMCEKRLLIPYYRCSYILLIDLINKKRQLNYNRYEKERANSLEKNVLAYVDEIRIFYVNIDNRSNLLMYISDKGFFRKKIERKIYKKMNYVVNNLNITFKENYHFINLEEKEIIKVRNVIEQYHQIRQINVKRNITNVEGLIHNCLYSIQNETSKQTGFLIKIKKINDQSFGISLFILAKNKKSINSLRESFILKLYNKAILNKRNFFFHINNINLKLGSKTIANFFPLILDSIGVSNGGYLGLFSEYNQDYVNYKKSKSLNQIILGHKQGGSERNKETVVSIPTDDLLLNIEIYGMIGQGKTSLVRSIIKQLSNQHVGSLVIDIKGEYAPYFINNSNVEIFTIGKPRPLCINIFQNKDENDIRNTLLIIEEMLSTINQTFSPAMKNLFETALFFASKAKNPNLNTFVEELFSLSLNYLEQQNSNSYIQQTLDAVLNRLSSIFSPINFDVLGVGYSTIDFSYLDHGKVIILDLSEFQKRAARPSDIFLITNLVLKMLYRYASSKGTSNKLKYVVIIEEALNTIPNIYSSESSASLITSENNFLLGRSLGIGHITVSQLWNSVSNIVHGNSATKIIFRSGDKVEKIANAINLSEELSSRLQTLPFRNCYAFVRGIEHPFVLKTVACSSEQLSKYQYRSLLNSKYQHFTHPLLYRNFIEMRSAIYSKFRNIQNKGKDQMLTSHYQKNLAINNLQNKIVEQSKAENKGAGAYLDHDTLTITDLDSLQLKETWTNFCNEYARNYPDLDVNYLKFLSDFVVKNIIKSYDIIELKKFVSENNLNFIRNYLKDKGISSDKHLIACVKFLLSQILKQKEFLLILPNTSKVQRSSS